MLARLVFSFLGSLATLSSFLWFFLVYFVCLHFAHRNPNTQIPKPCTDCYLTFYRLEDMSRFSLSFVCLGHSRRPSLPMTFPLSLALGGLIRMIFSLFVLLMLSCALSSTLAGSPERLYSEHESMQPVGLQHPMVFNIDALHSLFYFLTSIISNIDPFTLL